ncbi:MAG: hypothetical protein Q8O67_04460 [Deltaproteobacteria bacterium]|nr:hypothetical protein [Deltaproteobacteria bacterium]
MCRPRSLLFCLGLSFALAPQASAQSGAPADGAKPIFLVADVVVGEGVPIAKDAARDVLATRFGRLKDKIEVRSFAEAKASIDAVAMAQMMGSGDDADLARIESYMQVDRLVIGRVTQIAGTIDLQVKVFNVKEGVTEVAFARRLGKNADRSLILTMLDTLADSLLAWTIDNYTDGSLSKEATAMKAKKLGGKKPEAVASSSSSPWSTLGIVGAIGIGVGAGAASMGSANGIANGVLSNTDVGALVGGGVVLALGITLVTIDVVNGPPAE